MNLNEKSPSTSLAFSFLTPKYIESFPDSPFKSEFDFAISLYKKCDYHSSLRIFKHLEKLSVQKPTCQNNIACCYLNLGQKSSANLYLNRSILNLQNEIPIYNLALSHILDHNYGQAMKTINLCQKATILDFILLRKYIESKLPSVKKLLPRYSSVVHPHKSKFTENSTVIKPNDLIPRYLNVKFRRVQNINWEKLSLNKKSPVEKKEPVRAKSLKRIRPIEIPPKQETSVCGETDFKPQVRQESYLKEAKKSCNSSIFVQESLGPDFSSRFYDYSSRNFEENRGYLADPKTPDKLDFNYITETELKQVYLEMQKTPKSRNYEVLDRIIIKNSFFSRFLQPVRVELLKLSLLKEFNSNQTILNPGEAINEMFVILKGSVIIEKLSSQFGSYPVKVNTLYDGQYFGESSLVPEDEKEAQNELKNTSFKSIEKSLVLCLDKKKYNAILFHLAQYDISLKRTFLCLKNLDFLAAFNSNSLIPLASYLTIKSYISQEILLSADQIPEGLFIILSGFVSVVATGFKVVNKVKDCKIPENRSKKKETELNNVLYSLTWNSWKDILIHVTREDQSLSKENKELYIETIEHKILGENDYFASRALTGPAKDSDIKTTPSKFSIIAKSSIVEAVVIQPFHLSFVSQKMKNVILSNLSQVDDVDCPAGIDFKTIQNFLKEWAVYKSSMVNSIHQSTTLQKQAKFFSLYK